MLDDHIATLCQLVEIPAGETLDLAAWLIGQARTRNLNWLLAYADDGVIWGQLEGDRIRLSSDVFSETPARLRLETLQQAHLFGPPGELLIWRTDEGIAARYVPTSTPLPEGMEKMQETYWLWGSGQREKDGFTLMREGEMGLLHAVPLTGLAGRRAGIKLCHYVDFDDQGQALVILSCLQAIEPVTGGA